MNWKRLTNPSNTPESAAPETPVTPAHSEPTPAPSAPVEPARPTTSWTSPQAVSSVPSSSYGTSTTTAAPTSMTKPSNRNVLSSDVEIKGSVKFTSDLLVDGRIDGDIHSDGTLTVGENARIKAEIRVKSITIYGKVEGNITVTDRVELKANAELIGDIKAATLAIEPGAIFVGKSAVGAPSIPSKAAEAAKSPSTTKPASADKSNSTAPSSVVAAQQGELKGVQS